MTVDGIAVKGELQLVCDVACGDDGQASGLAPLHHEVVKDKWRLGAEGPEESRRSHRRSTSFLCRSSHLFVCENS